MPHENSVKPGQIRRWHTNSSRTMACTYIVLERGPTTIFDEPSWRIRVISNTTAPTSFSPGTVKLLSAKDVQDDELVCDV